MRAFTPIERSATFSLALVFGLRLLGLFLVLPVFSMYASHLPGATPALMGLAFGIYGLTQALLQIPFGRLSDKIQRKKVISAGLVLFIVGSLGAAFSKSIGIMILSRAVQGASAVGSATLALVADLTSEQHRPQAMGIVGITIGIAFFLAMVIGPVLTHWFTIPQLFLFTAGSGVLALFALWKWVPDPHTTLIEKTPRSITSLLFHPPLLLLNLGILTLHALLAANFVVFPFALQNTFGLSSSMQWKIYLPILVIACTLAFSILRKSKREQSYFIYQVAIACLLASEILLWSTNASQSIFLFSLLLFFTAFSLLEAWLPAFVSLAAPPHCKGAAMGIYSCSQFIGIFVGGSLAGTLYGKYHLASVFCMGSLLTGIWLLFEIVARKRHS